MSTGDGRRWRLVRAGRDAVPGSLRRFSARSRQGRWHAALPWLIAIAVVVVPAGIVGLVYGSSALAVRDVRVVGVKVLSPDQVAAAAAIRPGTPLARLDTDAVRGRVAKLAPVHSVEVDRQWPHRVVVRVVERTAVAAVPSNGRYILIDSSGVAFHSVAARPAGLPVFAVDTPGPRDESTRAALTVLDALTPQLRAQLQKLSASRPTRIRLELAKGRTVVWGDATDNAAKAKVATALLARPGAEIDVSAPGVVTVR